MGTVFASRPAALAVLREAGVEECAGQLPNTARHALASADAWWWCGFSVQVNRGTLEQLSPTERDPGPPP